MPRHFGFLDMPSGEAERKVHKTTKGTTPTKNRDNRANGSLYYSKFKGSKFCPQA